MPLGERAPAQQRRQHNRDTSAHAVQPPDHPQSGSLQPATVAVTAGRPAHEPDQPLNVPITMASTYVAGGDLEYGRYGNPTWTAFETALGALEGGHCLAYASGMAAITSLLDLVALGDKVVVPRHSYNGTWSSSPTSSSAAG